MTHPQIFAVTQLNKLYDYPSEEIVIHVENGIALPQVAECLRLRNELQELEGVDVETVNEFVKLINFSSPNEIDDFATDKIIYNGRALTAQQFEDVLVGLVTGEGSQAHSMQAYSVIEYPHDKIIESVLDGVHDAFASSADPVKEVLERIKDELDGDVLLAYHLSISNPIEFRQFLEGKIDSHSLHYVGEGVGNEIPSHENDDAPLYEEI